MNKYSYFQKNPNIITELIEQGAYFQCNIGSFYGLYGKEAKRWQYVSKVIDEVMEKYNYDFIRVPVFESSELFHRGVGETTDIVSKENNDCAPLYINGSKLHGIHYESPIASAQVKSSILFAGMYADSETSVTEPYISRNHSEKMIKYFGGDITTVGTTHTLTPNPKLEGQKVVVPGDISSAAYFITAGLIVEGSEILVKNVGINPTRDGLIEVVRAMGGHIELMNFTDEMEPCADIFVKYSNLKGTTIGGSLIPRLIDEIPIIAVLACFAEGQTVIKDAQELKVKESNRIEVIVENLQRMGADITPTDDGMIINGGKPLKGAVLGSRHDHRIAMSFAIAGLASEGKTEIIGSECVNISYPDFYADLASLKTE